MILLPEIFKIFYDVSFRTVFVNPLRLFES